MATASASRTDRPTTKNDETDGRLVALVAGTVGAAVVFVLVEQRVAEPILPLHLFKDPTFAIATSVGLIIGMGMFAALTLLPTFLQMSTGASVAGSGFLMLPMMAGVMLTAIGSGIAITKTGRRRMYPIVGMALATGGLSWLTRLQGGLSMVLFSAMIFVLGLGLGLGLVMRTIVLAVQSSVDPQEIGTATSANNLFHEIGAAVGVALFSTILTGRLTDRLTDVFADRSQEPVAQPSGEQDAATLTR